jgi:predicted Zn-dependent peptidase
MAHTIIDLLGLTLIVEEVPHTHSVSIGCFVAVGSGYEDQATSGASHFIEHLLFKGSQHYPSPKQIADQVEGVGGILDAYTDLESTVYYAKVATMHVARAIGVVADMLIRPLFLAQDIEKERRVIIEELRETIDTPSEYVGSILDLAMWGDQPLGRDIAGDEARLKKLKRPTLVRFWQSHYHRSNIIISVAGNITTATIIEQIRIAFAELPLGVRQPMVATTPAMPGPQLVVEPADIEQAHLALGLPGIALNDPDRRAMLVLDTILGGGMASRLVQHIREERGLAYTIGSERQEYHDAGKWLIYSSVDPEHLIECLAVIVAELHQLAEVGISSAELAQVKEQVKGGIFLSLEDTWAIAARNGSHQLRYRRIIPLEQVVAEVDAVTQADVHRLAQRLINTSLLHLAVIGPVADRIALEQVLR